MAQSASRQCLWECGGPIGTVVSGETLVWTRCGRTPAVCGLHRVPTGRAGGPNEQSASASGRTQTTRKPRVHDACTAHGGSPADGPTPRAVRLGEEPVGGSAARVAGLRACAPLDHGARPVWSQSPGRRPAALCGRRRRACRRTGAGREQGRWGGAQRVDPHPPPSRSSTVRQRRPRLLATPSALSCPAPPLVAPPAQPVLVTWRAAPRQRARLPLPDPTPAPGR